MVNSQTGTEMWVAENRVEEYKAAGHSPAASDTGEPADKSEKAAKKTKNTHKKR